MNRPAWTPRNDQERAEIARMDILAEQVRQAEAAVLAQARRMLDLRIPADTIARHSGLSKATIYRRVGPGATDSNVAAGTG